MLMIMQLELRLFRRHHGFHGARPLRVLQRVMCLLKRRAIHLAMLMCSRANQTVHPLRLPWLLTLSVMSPYSCMYPAHTVAPQPVCQLRLATGSNLQVCHSNCCFAVLCAYLCHAMDDSRRLGRVIAGMDAQVECRTRQPGCHRSSGPLPESPSLHSDPRPSGNACKPARASHGTAMLLQLCGQLPNPPVALKASKSPGKAGPAAAQQRAPATDQRLGKPYQGTHGAAGAIEAVHAPNAPALITGSAIGPSVGRRRRSAGASMLASIMGTRQGSAVAHSDKTSSDVHANESSALTLQHDVTHQAAVVRKNMVAGSPRPQPCLFVTGLLNATNKRFP